MSASSSPTLFHLGYVSTETGTLRSTGDRWTYRGDGGKATVQYGEWIVVNDPRRRYTLTVAP